VRPVHPAVSHILNLRPNWNVAPTQDVGAVVPEDGGRIYKTMRWRLVPAWAKDLKIGNQASTQGSILLLQSRCSAALGSPADALSRPRVPSHIWKRAAIRLAQAAPRCNPVRCSPVCSSSVFEAGLLKAVHLNTQGWGYCSGSFGCCLALAARRGRFSPLTEGGASALVRPFLSSSAASRAMVKHPCKAT
jgi:hypothetical protein